MTSITITSNAADTGAFLVNVRGRLRGGRRALNAALAARLEADLHAHFRARNTEPNKMGAPKTNYWEDISAATATTSISASGAVVSIADVRYRIQLFGGTIKPTGGRKFLTIPLIAEARARRAADYEKSSGHKLFRLPGHMVLVERTDQGDRSTLFGEQGTIRRRDGTFTAVRVRAKSTIRSVYALKTQVTVPKDPRALPPQAALASALQQTADAFVTAASSR